MSDLGNKDIMAKNIKYYLDRKGITGKDLAFAINVPPSTLYSWLQAASYPRIDKIEMMANYFGVSKAALVENHQGESLQDIFDRRPELRDLLVEAEKLNKRQLKLIIDIIRLLLND